MSAYEALYAAVAEAEGAKPEAVREALAHREVPDDGFWAAWDEAVREARDLYRRVAPDDGLDRESSASRQHYIDTGRYLPRAVTSGEDDAEGEDWDAVTDAQARAAQYPRAFPWAR